MTRPLTCLWLATLVGAAAVRLPALPQTPPAPATGAQGGVAPEDLDRLRRDQDEILRKTERLRGLMDRLLQRSGREGKKAQVELLKQGIAHLEQTNVLQDVAGIRDDLAATALSEALRKQKEVIDDLERLLNILLERKSIENLDQDVKQAAAMAATARELERRQAELERRTAQASKPNADPATQAIDAKLDELRRQEQNEAQANSRQAGTKRPFLENALHRVQSLLEQQQKLEKGVADEQSGADEAARAEQFDLGELLQHTRELQAQVRGQAAQDRLQQAAKAMTQALEGNDAAAVQQAKDRLQAQLQDAPKRPGGVEGPEADKDWQALRDELAKAPAGATPGERQDLQKLAQKATELADQRRAETATRNAADARKLDAEAGKTAAKLGDGKPPAEGSPAAAVQQAQQHIQEAGKQAAGAEPGKAQAELGKAMQSLEEARKRQQEQHPDAGRTAAQMAADAQAAAKELQDTPDAGAPEQQASKALDQARAELRQAEHAVDTAHAEGKRPDPGQSVARARAGLEQAKQTLEQALQQGNAERGGDLEQAKARQQQLREQTAQAKSQVQQAGQQGQMAPQQQKAVEQRLEQAEAKMQQAGEQLAQGQQSSAAQAQQQAAEALQQARQQLQQKQPLGQEQKQALQDLAKDQQKLQEDIVQLQREAKERQNKAAERDLEEAAEAARKAAQAMQQGDRDESEQQQEQARQKLDQAAKELEEERDRYQDLRQEELLFRMKDELTTFLQKQKPITQQTLEAAQASAKDGLSRPARHKLNQFSEEEQELANKLAFLVSALTEEGNLVYQSVLKANQEDLKEVARRLAGRSPDPGSYTTMLQQDVERRSEELLAALERERQRREQERKDRQQQQQQQQPKDAKNRFSPQRQQLVGLIAELEMLKQLELDTRKATNELKTLVELRGDEALSEAEAAMIERLGNRHADITHLFQQIKANVEQTMQGMQEPADGKPKETDRKGGK